LKIRTPGQQTSRKNVKPVVTVQSSPLPKDDGDKLYLQWPSRDEVTPEKARDELGRYATGKDKK
jgi:hypothetical protein